MLIIYLVIISDRILCKRTPKEKNTFEIPICGFAIIIYSERFLSAATLTCQKHPEFSVNDSIIPSCPLEFVTKYVLQKGH